MKSRTVRLGALMGLLVAVFLPILPYGQPTTACGFSFPCTFPYHGFVSLSFLLAGWGAVYWGNLPQSISQVLSLGFESGGWVWASNVGFILWDILPIAAACVWLLAPELARFSKVSRAGFGVFGAVLFALADLMLISMLQQTAFIWPFTLIGVFFGASGILMVMYAMHAWPLGVWEREDSPF